jgi:menaquinol-cytochrome c reductase iron-sulfur subunit
MEQKRQNDQGDRRSFLKSAAAMIVGGIAVLIPAAAGLMVLIDPLRRKSAATAAIKITTLDALPDDGVPRRFPVIASKTDAWNKFAEVPIGAIYLRRTKDGKVEALNVVCPHAGCFVDIAQDNSGFRCPCHQSNFAVDGTIADKRSPSPRGMDTLPVEIRPGGEVWVAFQNFQAGRPDKVPVS